MSTSQPEELKPTPGLRVDSATNDEIGRYCLTLDQYTEATSLEQAVIDAAWINQCLEDSEQRAKHLRRPDETGDLMVDLGDLTHAKIGTLVQDEAHEMQVIDYIDTFNNAVIQGIPPFRAVRAMAQAFGLVLANCMRANMHAQVCAALIQSVIEMTKAASQHLKIITSSQRHN